VILCTGVSDAYSLFNGWDAYVGRSLFWCLACDGYECKGTRVVVLGHTNTAAVEALQLQRFTTKLMVLTNSEMCGIDAAYQTCLRRANIPLVHDRITTVHGTDGRFEALYTAGGLCLRLDRLFCQPEMTPQTHLARELGVRLSPEGSICVDTEQITNISGVYAAM
jgi:thioredoxin reductase (NADPH)